MAISIPMIRKASAEISQKYGVTVEDAQNIIAWFLGEKRQKDAETVCNCLSDDLIKESATAQNIQLNGAGTRSAGKRAADDLQGRKKENKTDKTRVKEKEKTPAAGDQERRRPATVARDQVPTVAGDILPADYGRGMLPDGFTRTVCDVLEDFKSMHGFDDLSKLANVQWRAACLHVGMYIKETGLLHDRERERAHGGTVYDVGRISGLVDIWEYYTMSTKHIPLRQDFFAFCGIGYQWFYDSDAAGVTPERAEIVKKVEEIERAAVSSAVMDARENPTGRIWFEKSRYGLSEAPQITVNVTADVSSVAALPKFSD